jgi:plastocyanin
MRYRAGLLALTLCFALAPAAIGAEFRVSQKNKAFSASELTVRAGDAVTFVNDDAVTHNVHSSTKGAEFDLRIQAAGQSDRVRFETPTEVDVQCGIHPKMKMRIHVGC